MGALYGQRVTVGQAQGPDVELVVYGDEFYARYETPDGFPVVYDAERGQFSYARLDEGRFVSTGVPVTAPPPSGIERHAQENPEVRQEKAGRRAARQSPPPGEAGDPPPDEATGPPPDAPSASARDAPPRAPPPAGAPEGKPGPGPRPADRPADRPAGRADRRGGRESSAGGGVVP
jgi:hypothetical protein